MHSPNPDAARGVPEGDGAATAGATSPRVALAACPSYAPAHVAAAVGEACELLGGIAAFVRPGQTVLVKPNLLCPRAPEQAVTTHPELVRQVILACAGAGAARIWVGDSPAGTHDEADLWTRTGMQRAVEGTPGVLKSWQARQTPVACGEDVLPVPEWYGEVDAVISMPKLKTHSLTTLTCGMKNVYGIVSGPAKAMFHAKYPSPQSMSAFLVRVYGALTPHLTIADAVMAMEGHGPANGHPVALGVLLASRDAVALDTVACQALRLRPSAVPMLRLAAQCGMGRLDRDRIECTGSGLPTYQAARLRPSLARYLSLVPEPLFQMTTRLFRVRPRIQEAPCTRCGVCVDTCPRQAIAKSADGRCPSIDPARCIVCFCCVESCPRGAVAMQMYLGSRLRVARQSRRKEKPT